MDDVFELLRFSLKASLVHNELEIVCKDCLRSLSPAEDHGFL